MKRLVCFALALALWVWGCAPPTAPNNASEEKLVGVWLAYYEFRFQKKSAEQFRNEAARIMDNIASGGANAVFCHVVAHCDVIYPSKLLPWSNSGDKSVAQGTDPGFDPLSILIAEAKRAGLQFHAWINPYRVARGIPQEGEIYQTLAENHPVRRWLTDNDKANDAAVCEIRAESGRELYLNPADIRAMGLILGVVREILDNYAVDGIHFDDYFYPFSDPFFDMDSYCAYKLPGGGLSQGAWRRQNVALFLRDCYEAVHSSGCGRFGISPKGFMACNTDEEFLDVPRILSQPGFVDYVCPQAYFAMNDEISPFSAVMAEYESLIKADIELMAGLAVYKLGFDDRWAGPAGRAEWLSGSETLKNMVSCAREHSHYAGFSLYNYQASFLPAPERRARVEAEMSALKRSL